MHELDADQLLKVLLPMTDRNVQDPKVFVAALQQYHESPEDQRGHLANALSELIIRKRVDLAEVRHELLGGGHADLLDTLDRLLDLIEPYIEEGGPAED